MKVEGVDRVALEKVQSKTREPVVQEAEKLRVQTEEERGRQRQAETGTGQQDLEKAVRELNQTAAIFNTRLLFKLDRENDEIYVLVIDREEGRVIRRIPPENVLRAALQLEEIVGLLLDALV